MGGRITAVSVFEADPTTYWVATASGGLLKTTNNGITFEHQFDHEATVSIGDVCVAPSDRNIVWVGTGESNPRNSVSYGDGVYKSTDGGKTWKNMGPRPRRRSGPNEVVNVSTRSGVFQIGRIVVHPTNPDVVYVGALGRLYGPNEERGLFKTTDGGKTWQKILYVDDKTGVIDVKMHPTDPETLLVAAYERQRDIYDSNDPAKKYGSGSALYRTTDGGKTFKKITKGLPTCKLGRIGLDYYRKDPRTVYLVLESEKIGDGPPEIAAAEAYLGARGENAPLGALLIQVVPKGPADKAGLRPDDVITALGGRPVSSNRVLLEVVRGHKAGDKVKVRVRRGTETKELDLTFGSRADAPGEERLPFTQYLGGQRENVQDRQGKDGYQYGGVYRSTDGGESWTRLNSLNPRPMYFSQIRVDPNDEQYLYVLGISLHRSTDGGKSFRAGVARGVHSDHHAMWIDPRDSRHMILAGDGGTYVSYDRGGNWDRLNHAAIGQFYHVAVDTRREYKVYGGLQDNGSWGGPAFTRGSEGPVNEDWFSVGGGDGFTCRVDASDPDLVYSTGQWGNIRRRNLRTGESATIRPRAAYRYRFNWNSPFILSHRNPRIFYSAGNVVFRSLDRGDDLRVISPEITSTDKGSATALAESPRNPDVLWAGTDDGHLWVTRDGGAKWTNVTKNVKLPGLRCVASIEASRAEEGRAYVVFDGHRSDDDNPYVFVTEDFGQTWKALSAGLPWGSTRCLREDIINTELLYLGTEFGAWCSLDRGRSWNRLNTNLPTVAVHEFAIHPTAGEVVAATHGRSLWVLNVTALRQLTPESLKAVAKLYRPAPAVRWPEEPFHGRTNRRFVGQNPPFGAQLYYSLGRKAADVHLKVLDIDGKLVRELQAEKGAGLHRVTWDLTSPAERRQGTGGGGRPRQRGGAAPGRPVPAGMYVVLLTVDGTEYRQPVRVEGEPRGPGSFVSDDDEE
jgi:photosystem II stability/assembly factor-like uncharacterized protein